MATVASDKDRLAALDAYLAMHHDRGYRVETRSDRQAVICRRHPFYVVLRWVARSRAEQRLVVWVDAYGKVTAVAAEPLRS
jgi:type II secretory pathway component PulM